MTKILTARKYKSNNPFTKYMQKNIEERYLVYHEDWKKFEVVKQKLIYKRRFSSKGLECN